ncbi:MAG: ABC transporter substrate-binding protein [Chloroflexi bacterium]|nr:ABC transporter substrate-binding protein [Chloroflexota bacterium]
MRFFNDFLGREITIPTPPQRIVSLAPDMTEMVFRLGLGDAVVGISSFCHRPAEQLEGLPRLGSYLKIAWSRLEALKPDVVLTTLGAQRETAYRLLDAGYPVLALPVPLSIFGILENVRRLAAALGVAERGEHLNAQLAETLTRWRGALPPLRVYWEIDLGGPITAGPLTYVNDALHWLGLRNIYADLEAGYVAPDDTETRARAPEIILYEPTRTRNPERALERMKDRLGLAHVPVVLLPHDALAHYGPALIDEVMPEVVARVRAVLAQGATA